MNEFIPESWLIRLRKIGVHRVRLISNSQFFCAHIFMGGKTMDAGLLADRCRRAGARARVMEFESGGIGVWVHTPDLESFEKVWAVIYPISPEGRKQTMIAEHAAREKQDRLAAACETHCQDESPCSDQGDGERYIP